ncbi:hypothetical protein FRC17_004918 [Serendipita sp. 399]|nr:hypothetical protein FRC17_004918 [Serendipita sp. 399]
MLSIGGTAQGLHDSQTQTQTDSLQSFANDPFLRIDSPVAGGIRRIRLVGLPKEQAWRRAGEMLFAIATHVSSAQEGRLFVKPEKEKGGEQQEELEKAKQEVAFLNNELKKHDEPAIAPPPKPTPGRSLANPSKKARKVKEVEFADSDDEGEPKRVKKRR